MAVIPATKLDKKSREALPDADFAFPRTRQGPMHDAHHTKLAWDTVDRTKGVTLEECRAARERILVRASVLGMDTREWSRLKNVKAAFLSCMSLNIANDDDHPNKMPFSGVLTKLDEPSDSPPGGANGKCIIVTTAAARAALGSLLGMAVDFTPSFDGHDAKTKIGIITSADIVGNELTVEGFIYAADFPDTAELIQALKDVLGFSFEAQRLTVQNMAADILTITELTFTGAAILRKDKAAYETTSLAASAANEEIDMTTEELRALLGPMLAEAVKPLADRLDKVESNSTAAMEVLNANAAVRNMVEPHCASLESCHAAMEAAGIGTSTGNGHVHVLRRMADSMRAEAAMGKVPSIWRDHDYPYYASADNSNTTQTEEVDLKKDEVTALIAEAVTAALKPLQDELTATKDKLAAAETKLTDANNVQRLVASGPQRKTLTPAGSAILNRASIAMPEAEGAKLDIGTVDKALMAAAIPMTQRIMLKNELGRIGAL